MPTEDVTGYAAEHESGQLSISVAGEQVSALPLPDPPGRYVVKCDECKAEIRRTDSVAESAAGGHCDACRAELDARYPERLSGERCEVCGDPVTVDELERVRSDVDFVEHGDREHLVRLSPPRRTRRERLEARAERRREWAGGRAAKAAAASDRVHAIADGIPFGQPILVGHHSEGRARRDQARIEAGMRATVEHGRKAEEHAEKADGIERQLRSSVFSDDVDAVEQLAARIGRLEGERDRVKRYNVSCRAGRRDVELLDEAQQAELLSLARIGRLGDRGELPSYMLRNLGGEIRRNRERLERVKREQAAAAAGVRIGGRVMLARFESCCADCGGTIEKGSPITYYRSTREAVHVDCPKEV